MKYTPSLAYLAFTQQGTRAGADPQIQDLNFRWRGASLVRATGAESIWGFGMGGVHPSRTLPRKCFFLNFIFGSRNAHFSAFSGPSECVLLPVIRPGPDLQYACPL